MPTPEGRPCVPLTIADGHTNFFETGFEVFGHLVSVMFCDDVKDTMVKLHPEIGRVNDAEALIYKYTCQAKSEIFIKFDAKFGSITHEAFHAVWNIFEYHGMKRDDEAMAYHLGYLVEAIVGAQIEALEARHAESEDWPLGL
jgi:hypothetical protein